MIGYYIAIGVIILFIIVHHKDEADNSDINKLILTLRNTCLQIIIAINWV